MTTSTPRTGPRHAAPDPTPEPAPPRTVADAVARRAAEVPEVPARRPGGASPRPRPQRPPVGSFPASGAPLVPAPRRARSARRRAAGLVAAFVVVLGATGGAVVARSSDAVADDLRRLDVTIPFVDVPAAPSTPTR